MSGSKSRRRVTVDQDHSVTGSTESTSPDKRKPSVFERLGAVSVGEQEVCRDWVYNNQCNYGASCKYLHPPKRDRERSGMEETRHRGSKKRDHSEEKSPNTSPQRPKKREKSSRRDKESRKSSVKSAVVVTKTGRGTEGEIRDSDPTMNDDSDLDFDSTLRLMKKRQQLQQQLSMLEEAEKAEASHETITIERAVAEPESDGDYPNVMPPQAKPRDKSRKSESERQKMKTKKKKRRDKGSKLMSPPSPPLPAPSSVPKEKVEMKRHSKEKRHLAVMRSPEVPPPKMTERSRSKISPISFPDRTPVLSKSPSRSQSPPIQSERISGERKKKEPVVEKKVSPEKQKRSRWSSPIQKKPVDSSGSKEPSSRESRKVSPPPDEMAPRHKHSKRKRSPSPPAYSSKGQDHGERRNKSSTRQGGAEDARRRGGGLSQERHTGSSQVTAPRGRQTSKERKGVSAQIGKRGLVKRGRAEASPSSSSSSSSSSGSSSSSSSDSSDSSGSSSSSDSSPERSTRKSKKTSLSPRRSKDARKGSHIPSSGREEAYRGKDLYSEKHKSSSQYEGKVEPETREKRRARDDVDAWQREDAVGKDERSRRRDPSPKPRQVEAVYAERKQEASPKPPDARGVRSQVVESSRRSDRETGSSRERSSREEWQRSSRDEYHDRSRNRDKSPSTHPEYKREGRGHSPTASVESSKQGQSPMDRYAQYREEYYRSREQPSETGERRHDYSDRYSSEAYRTQQEAQSRDYRERETYSRSEGDVYSSERGRNEREVYERYRDRYTDYQQAYRNDTREAYYRYMDDRHRSSDDRSRPHDAHERGRTSLDEHGRLIDDRGRLVNDLGRLIDDRGRLVDDRGRLVDDRGRLIDDRGRFVDDHGRLVDSRGRYVDDRGRAIDDRLRIDDRGRLMDDRGRLLDDRGRFVDDRGRVMDDHGRLLDDRGRVVDERGRVVADGGRFIDERGRLVDERGRLIDDRGRLVDDRGRVLDDRPRVDDRGRLVDDRGRLVDDRGRLVDDHGRLVDDRGRLIDEHAHSYSDRGRLDEHGRLVDERGRPVDHSRLIDERGKLVDSRTAPVEEERREDSRRSYQEGAYSEERKDHGRSWDDLDRSILDDRRSRDYHSRREASGRKREDEVTTGRRAGKETSPADSLRSASIRASSEYRTESSASYRRGDEEWDKERRGARREDEGRERRRGEEYAGEWSREPAEYSHDRGRDTDKKVGREGSRSQSIDPSSREKSRARSPDVEERRGSRRDNEDARSILSQADKQDGNREGSHVDKPDKYDVTEGDKTALADERREADSRNIAQRSEHEERAKRSPSRSSISSRNSYHDNRSDAYRDDKQPRRDVISDKRETDDKVDRRSDRDSDSIYSARAVSAKIEESSDWDADRGREERDRLHDRSRDDRGRSLEERDRSRDERDRLRNERDRTRDERDPSRNIRDQSLDERDRSNNERVHGEKSERVEESRPESERERKGDDVKDAGYPGEGTKPDRDDDILSGRHSLSDLSHDHIRPRARTDSHHSQEKQHPTEVNGDTCHTDGDVSVPSVEYDDISDDDLDDIISEGGSDTDSKSNQGVVQALDINWDILQSKNDNPIKAVSSEGSWLKRFSPGAILSRIGISQTYGGPDLVAKVKDVCRQHFEEIEDDKPVEKVAEKSEPKQDSDDPRKPNQDTGDSKTGISKPSQSVADKMAALDKMLRLPGIRLATRRGQGSVTGDIGPFRRALCARRDLAIRRRLCKVDKIQEGMNLYPITMPDLDLYKQSLQLFHQDKSNNSLGTDKKLMPQPSEKLVLSV